MKKVFVLFVVCLSIIISNICAAASPAVTRLHNTYTNGIGFWSGYTEAVYEIVEANDIAGMTQVRDKVNTDNNVFRTIKTNLDLLGKSASETGNGVPTSLHQAFINAWRLKYLCSKPIMEKIVFNEGKISAWSQQEKDNLRNLLKESEKADEAYFSEMRKAGIKP